MAGKSTPYADLQTEICRRKYPESYWINWFIKTKPFNITLDNIDRCLKQNPCSEDRDALLWLRREVSAIIQAKRHAALAKKTKTVGPAEPKLSPSPALAPFFAHLPPKPYCTNELEAGLRVRPMQKALDCRYLQANGPGMTWTLIQDVDRDISAEAMAPSWTLGPEPAAIVLNPRNGHGHLLWYLEAGVTTTSAGRLGPLRFLGAVEEGLRRAVGGDPGYSGLITKNPFHRDWVVVERNPHLWTLGDLAARLDLRAANARKWSQDVGIAIGIGRNVSLFDRARHWAYAAVQEYWAPNGYPWWQDAVLEYVAGLNSQFSTPLPFSEVKSISKSIAKWVWRHMTPAGLQALIQRTHSPEWQRARGKKASNQALAGKAAKNQREAGRMARNQRAIAASGGRASGLSRRRAREETMALAIRFCKNMKTMGASVRAISEALETIHGIRVSHATVWRWIR